MKRKYPHSCASVLILTLLILSIVTIFTQQLVRSTFVGTYFNRAMVSREHAEMLALGGIRIAMANLQIQKKVQQGDEKKPQPQAHQDKKEDSPEKKMLRRVMPYLNRWQVFDLDEVVDGITGQVRVCVSSEQGKLAINELFDFKKGEFSKEAQAVLKNLSLKKVLPSGVLLKKLTEFLAKRKKPLDTISELRQVKGLEKIPLFYTPPQIPGPKQKAKPNESFALQDLFTVWSESSTVDPLLFSDSVCSLFGLRRPQADDAERIKDKFKRFLDAYKKEWGKDWIKNWQSLQVLYDHKPKNLKEIQPLLSQEFEPRVYSVLSCGKVNDVEQYLVAIIEKQDEEKTPEKENKKTAQQRKDKEKKRTFTSPFRIKRIYWL